MHLQKMINTLHKDHLKKLIASLSSIDFTSLMAKFRKLPKQKQGRLAKTLLNKLRNKILDNNLSLLSHKKLFTPISALYSALTLFYILYSISIYFFG